MIWAALVGAVSGAVMIVLMQRSGMLNERSGLAVLVGAVALFYPVFAVQANAGLIVIAAHIAVFVGFVLLGLWGFATGSAILAGALILHGVFDIFAHFAGAPGPAWWPAMCGALDVTAGALVLFYLSKNKVTP